ncbi:hypothetical protein [Dyella sp.]|uniref:hypothetical protein n=1 Tax=Dyella sp. TaxID=1869338 RepID=UPI002FD95134
MTKKTERNGTHTLQGWIPHLEICSDFGAIYCPVRVVTSRRDLSNLPLPSRDERGALIYALPGGGEMQV